MLYSTSGIGKLDDMSSRLDLNSFMRTFDQYIYVISGYQNGTLSITERLDLAKGSWEEMAEVKIARTKFGVVCPTNDSIVLLGGKTFDGQRTTLIEEYDIKKNMWVLSDYQL